MGIDTAHYHGWNGKLHSPWLACLAIVRVALLQVFRRKLYWIVLALGLVQFLLFWSIIYGVTQLKLPADAQQGLLERFGFAANPGSMQQSGYLTFIDRQNVVVMILLAFSGSLLVGSDFRQGSLPFFLSRRIDRRHYIFGKLLAVSTVVSLLTVVPALLLFVEYGMFTSSFDYWIDHWRVPLAVLAYGLVICTVLSIMLVTLSAYLQRPAPIAITWSTLFVMLGRLGSYLHHSTGNSYWRLLDPWHDIGEVGHLLFGAFDTQLQQRHAQWALAILTTISVLCLFALVHRVRAVEIVE